MKKDLTEIIFILDRSGSMGGLEDDTIGGFNAMLEKQKALPGEAYVSTVLFDNEREVVHDRVSIQQVPPLTRETYFVRGSTALLDAVGKAIQHIGTVHRYARDEDVPEHTMMIITTDGMENASSRYTRDEIKKMIEYRTKEYGWQFIFLGANIDTVETAKSYGIMPECAVSYHSDSVGTRKNYEAVSGAIKNVRSGKSMGSQWRGVVDEDFKNRT